VANAATTIPIIRGLPRCAGLYLHFILHVTIAGASNPRRLLVMKRIVALAVAFIARTGAHVRRWAQA